MAEAAATNHRLVAETGDGGRSDFNGCEDLWWMADEGGPRPVLVHRIPYDKSIAQHVGSQMVNPLVAAEQGYAVVGNHGHAVRGVCDLSQSCHPPLPC